MNLILSTFRAVDTYEQVYNRFLVTDQLDAQILFNVFIYL